MKSGKLVNDKEANNDRLEAQLAPSPGNAAPARVAFWVWVSRFGPLGHERVAKGVVGTSSEDMRKPSGLPSPPKPRL